MLGNQENMADAKVVLIRGAGEQASGVGWTLAKAGFRVAMTEVPKPLMVRRSVCFGTAVAEGVWQVEKVTARKVDHPRQFASAWEKGEIPIIVDHDLQEITDINPTILIDGIMAKRNTGTKKDMAPLTIGLGPGFVAGKDVNLVIETNRGHNLGRIIYSGPAEPNTGIPGLLEGFTKERVIYSAKAGIFKSGHCIGQQVRCGDVIGEIYDGISIEYVVSSLDGVLRGLIHTDTSVKVNMKIGDVDPRGKEEFCWTISEKARAIGAGVLLGILEWNTRDAKDRVRC
ncbi:MAG: NADP-binding protein [Gracilibacter sp. BRH_c7a]|nr:MAG: NADP-binding protein [Gracilibacter sp. BRH_c7a]